MKGDIGNRVMWAIILAGMCAALYWKKNWVMSLQGSWANFMGLAIIYAFAFCITGVLFSERTSWALQKLISVVAVIAVIALVAKYKF